MLRYNKDTGAPDPTKPLAGTLLKYLDTDESSTQHLLVHADTTYANTIYGCEGANCLITCTTTTNESDDATTERERWVLQGIHDYDQDTGARVLGTATWPEQHCPELYRFRTGNSYTARWACTSTARTARAMPTASGWRTPPPQPGRTTGTIPPSGPTHHDRLGHLEW